MRATLATAKYLTALGTPASIIAKLISTEPEDMAFLKADELTQSGWATYYDDNGIDQQTATASSFGMSCEAEKGIYAVNWSGGGYIQVRDLWYAVTKSHVAKTNAWVATGQTKYGTYAAVFGGPNPRMEFSNGKEVVKDRCGSATSYHPNGKPKLKKLNLALVAVLFATVQAGRTCHPNYDPCVPVASDVDCASGSGNGPAYVEGPVRVIGIDIYGLDRDGDGVACE